MMMSVCYMIITHNTCVHVYGTVSPSTANDEALNNYYNHSITFNSHKNKGTIMSFH